MRKLAAHTYTSRMQGQRLILTAPTSPCPFIQTLNPLALSPTLVCYGEHQARQVGQDLMAFATQTKQYCAPDVRPVLTYFGDIGLWWFGRSATVNRTRSSLQPKRTNTLPSARCLCSLSLPLCSALGVRPLAPLGSEWMVL
jgi:hypothetical protein